MIWRHECDECGRPYMRSHEDPTLCHECDCKARDEAKINNDKRFAAAQIPYRREEKPNEGIKFTKLLGNFRGNQKE